jgi:puromycin-sensitive aminopeptidase
MLNLLLPAVKDQSLPPLDRLGLQNDLFAMVQAGRTPTVEILKLIDAFINEDNYVVWNSINACLGKLNVLLSHTDYLLLFQAYGRQLLAKTHSRLGWNPIKGERHLDTLLRSLVINRLATFEDQLVLDESRKLFDSHCNGTLVIPADLRSAVYRAVAIGCDDKTFEALFKVLIEMIEYWLI